jgi:hypothetical protein
VIVAGIEELLHVSPDGGNGSPELAIFLGLVAVAVIAASLSVRLERRHRPCFLLDLIRSIIAGIVGLSDQQ